MVDVAPRYRSTVEDYRSEGSRYDREPLPYDMSEPFDLAVWIATLVYIQTSGADRHSGEQVSETRPSSWELEQDLRDLAANARAVLGNFAAERLKSRESMTTPLAVLCALFPAGDSAASEVGGVDPKRAPAVPPDLWRTSSGWLRHFEEDANHTESEHLSDENTNGVELEQHGGVEEENKEKDLDDDKAPESTEREGEQRRALLTSPLATVVYMARLALGKTVTQSEAARRLGISPARVNALLSQGRLCHLRVGRTVLLLEEEVSMGLRDLRRIPGTPGSW